MDNITEKKIWEKCVAFHGHECGGLAIGFKAALYAIELLNLEFSEEEETVCISENDACGIDAVQVILGCTVGRGNLLFHLRGKQAFNFYDRNSGRSVRLVLKPRPSGMSRQESFDYYRLREPKELFDVKATVIELPEKARIFTSYKCDCCGEETASEWIRPVGEQKLCIDCYAPYKRFDV